MIKCGSSGSLHRSVVHSSRTTVPEETKKTALWTIIHKLKVPLKHLGWEPFPSLLSARPAQHQTFTLSPSRALQTCVHRHHSLTLCYPRIWATGVRSASTMASFYRREERSGPALYLRSRSLFDAILSLSQSLISGLPHPSAAREHPTYPFSGGLRLLCPHNDKAHVKTVNGESNPNPENSLNSKTTWMHEDGRMDVWRDTAMAVTPNSHLAALSLWLQASFTRNS